MNDTDVIKEKWVEYVTELVDSVEARQDIPESDVGKFKNWMYERQHIGRAWDKRSWCHWYWVWDKLNDSKRNDDHMIAVTANPGTGKTTQAQLIAATVSGKRFEVKSFVYNSLDFTMRVHESLAGDSVIIDEGERLLLNTQSQTKEQNETVQTIMQMRFKNVLTIICIPSYFKINEYVRNERLDELVWIWHKDVEKGRSHSRVFNMRKQNEEARMKIVEYKKRKGKINLMDTRMSKYLYYDAWNRPVWANFSEADYVAHMKQVDWDKWVAQVKERQNGKVGVTSKYYTIPEVCKLLNINRSTVKKWIDEKKVVGTRVGIMWRVERDKIDAIINHTEDSSRDMSENDPVGGFIV